MKAGYQGKQRVIGELDISDPPSNLQRGEKGWRLDGSMSSDLINYT